jgi:hypothetical protein
MTTPEPSFDIFSGTMDRYAMWIEAVPGLAQARERMEQIAKEKPGRYFVFSTANHTILAEIDTTPKRSQQQTPGKKDIA